MGPRGKQVLPHLLVKITRISNKRGRQKAVPSDGRHLVFESFTCFFPSFAFGRQTLQKGSAPVHLKGNNTDLQINEQTCPSMRGAGPGCARKRILLKLFATPEEMRPRPHTASDEPQDPVGREARAEMGQEGGAGGTGGLEGEVLVARTGESEGCRERGGHKRWGQWMGHPDEEALSDATYEVEAREQTGVELATGKQAHWLGIALMVST